MSPPSKKPEHQIVTHRVRSKKRFAVVTDVTLLNLMKVVGRPLTATPRMQSEATGTLVGIYALPTNNVLELFTADGGGEVGYLFTNLDVWMSFDGGVDHE